ncbi:uncharacterized protein LOC124266398 [Haliotis rubra]|uniref:uncharacterized protein LOC124266398 n=1 Tax=Haliotis rubra TaxID=36100 RepID=UPI001EE55DAA|nr:uncharacterized protein LOC124266398 [Haliotis rubra]
MPHWREKCHTYHLGTVCTTLGCLGYLITFSVPTWKQTYLYHTVDSQQRMYTTSGLWLQCVGWTRCKPFVTGDTMFQSVRFVAIMALTFSILTVYIIFLHNCTTYSKRLQSENAVISVFPIFPGLLSIASCVLFLASQGTVTASWAVSLTFISGALCIGGGMIMFLGLHFDRCRASRTISVNHGVIELHVMAHLSVSG